MRNVVIVGAGECGTRAAFALREAGFAGDITLVGEEPYLPYERPPLSKPRLDDTEIREIAPRERFVEAGIELATGITVTALDRAARRVALSDGRNIAYDKLLLATGARARPLPGDPQGHAQTFRSRDDAARVYDRARPGTRAVLIGAGLIGLELAAELRHRGMEVTVVEMAQRALGRCVPAELAEALTARHRQEGVTFHFGAAITDIEGGAVVLASGERLPADLILAAIGVLPNTELAAAAGLAVDNGICTDERLQTQDPAIFAAGDCAACHHPRYGRVRFESWRNAQDQGEAAAQAMLGEDAPFATVPWFWSDQYDLGLQVTGLPDPAQKTVTRPLSGAARILFHLSPEGRLAAASGLGPGTAVAKEIRLAEMLVAKDAAPAPEALADPGVNLKTLLRA